MSLTDAQELGFRLAERDCSPEVGRNYIFYQFYRGVTSVAELVGAGPEVHDQFVKGYTLGLSYYGQPDTSLF